MANDDSPGGPHSRQNSACMVIGPLEQLRKKVEITNCSHIYETKSNRYRLCNALIVICTRRLKERTRRNP